IQAATQRDGRPGARGNFLAQPPRRRPSPWGVVAPQPPVATEAILARPALPGATEAGGERRTHLSTPEPVPRTRFSRCQPLSTYVNLCQPLPLAPHALTSPSARANTSKRRPRVRPPDASLLEEKHHEPGLELRPRRPCRPRSRRPQAHAAALPQP